MRGAEVLAHCARIIRPVVLPPTSPPFGGGHALCPPEHWRRIRTSNPLERIIREVRRRICVVGPFPDGHAALMLVAARLRHVSGSRWGTRRYLDVTLLRNRFQEAG